MRDLIYNFWNYLKLYSPRILPITIISLIVGSILFIVAKKGYMKKRSQKRYTIVSGLLFSLSIAVVFVLTLYGREKGEKYSYCFLMLSSYREAFQHGNTEILLQIIMNIVMFIPIGVSLPLCFERFEKNRFLLGTALSISVFIECIQGIVRIGMFELDDILGNVAGAEIGFVLYHILYFIMKKRRMKIRLNTMR